MRTITRANVRRSWMIASIGVLVIALAANGMGQETARMRSDYSSSLVGIAAGEKASIHVSNVQRRAIEVEIYFVGGDGNIIKFTRGLILPYKSMSLELSYRELGGMGQRELVRAHVRTSQANQAGATTCIDVSDEATGRTSFGLLLPAVVGFDPQPDPPAQ